MQHMGIIRRKKGRRFPTGAQLRLAGFAVSTAVARPQGDNAARQAPGTDESDTPASLLTQAGKPKKS